MVVSHLHAELRYGRLNVSRDSGGVSYTILRSQTSRDWLLAERTASSAVTAVARKYSCRDVGVILFCQNTFTVVTSRNIQNDLLHTHPFTKKTSVATKRLRTQLPFS